MKSQHLFTGCRPFLRPHIHAMHPLCAALCTSPRSIHELFRFPSRRWYHRSLVPSIHIELRLHWRILSSCLSGCLTRISSLSSRKRIAKPQKITSLKCHFFNLFFLYLFIRFGMKPANKNRAIRVSHWLPRTYARGLPPTRKLLIVNDLTFETIVLQERIVPSV